MPTRTDIVIKLGEVIDCLPPSKAFKRRRYNSFDANSQGNEENLAPELSGVSIMKPVVKLEAEDDDEEVSFRYNNGDSEGSRSKPKRKTSAEKFLEDNVNYFQLEVLPSKTRSNKRIADNGDSGDDEASKEGFHNSFLDFLKSKDVEKEESNGRCRHKSEGEREGRSRTVAGRLDGTNSDKRNGEEIKEKEKEVVEGTVVGQLRPERNSVEQNSNEGEEANLAESAAKKKREVASSPRSSKKKKRRITRGQVMSLHKALGGNTSSEEDEVDEQPLSIWKDGDIDRCPRCSVNLEVSREQLTLNVTDLSILLDCNECGVRLRLRGFLGDHQLALLSCGQ